MALSTNRTLITQTGINTHQVLNVGGLDSAGIATFSNFKTGSTNVHSVGVEAAGINVLGGDTPIGAGSTIFDDGGARFIGIVTASGFSGDGSSLTGVASTDNIKTSTTANFTGGIQVGGSTTLTGALSATTATANLVVVGSAVTSNSQGIDVTGVVTATSFVGSGANLTSLPAANLTGTLPAIDGSNLTGVGASFGNSSINSSGIITATAFVPSQGQLSHRNLIINGAMQVAQRGTSHGSSGYRTVDRFTFNGSGLNASVTTEQADVASGTTPYASGFRKSHKITNGAQTGPDAGDHIYFSQKIEAQNMATSGWNYLSSSSNITLSFWVKSSVAQNFYGYLVTKDGSSYLYPFETGSLSADTWTKITKTIPGNSNLQIDNDNGTGLELVIAPFFGTSKTGSVSLNAWGAYNTSVRVPDMTSTWYTTNGATFEYTAVQLEVGSVATPFEHRSFGDELYRCQRYFISINNEDDKFFANGTAYGSSQAYFAVPLPTTMRALPTLVSYSGSGSVYRFLTAGNSRYSASLQSWNNGDKTTLTFGGQTSGLSSGNGVLLGVHSSATGNTNSSVAASAEL